MVEQTLTVAAGPVALAGTFTAPDGPGPFPAVVFVHGSGPLDRDENMKGQKLDVFNTLARHLAAHGIASFRYDKRGCGGSSGSYLRAGHSDLVGDATAATRMLLDHRQVAPGAVFLVGHSEGSIIVPQVAVRLPETAGIVLICPFLTPLPELLKQQARQLAVDIHRQRGFPGSMLRAWTKIAGGPERSQEKLIKAVTGSSGPVTRVGLRRINALWFRELFALNLVEVYRSADCPALLLAGGKDIQCDPADAAAIAGLMTQETEWHVLDDLTHVLRREPGTPTFFGYRKLLDQPLDPELLRLLTQWLTGRAGRGS